MDSSKPIDHASDLGALIKVSRKAAGLTLLQTALSCGVSVKFLQALETGKPTVQFDKALGVARHFGIGSQRLKFLRPLQMKALCDPGFAHLGRGRSRRQRLN